MLISVVQIYVFLFDIQTICKIISIEAVRSSAWLMIISMVNDHLHG